MGNSGFFNDGTETIVYADNISLSGTGGAVTPMFTSDGQIMVGSTIAPHVRMSTLNGTGGIVVDNSTTGISLSFNPKLADPSVISTVFQSDIITDVVECTSIFNNSNINSVTAGNEILRLSVTPAYKDSVLVFTAHIIASRREGNIGLSLIQDGETAPLCFSVGYSSGYPNLCTLFYMLPVVTIQTFDLSIRVGGIDSGPVIINGLPNKTKVLAKTLSSYCIVQESVRQAP